uniref:ATP synthase CF1 epsilon subunit, chloroplastic n=1 Tax=Tanacetum cinerariifolium TaxID=118510 RepID=A0A6L2KWT7_TANCI|nr:ATP synthase CF1 epsilon subunit, chloroplastic [Tanacetum cinerariifolium]
MFLMGGFAIIGNNEISVLVYDAEKSGGIDSQKAHQTFEIAKVALRKAKEKRQTIESNLALRRARTQLEAMPLPASLGFEPREKINLPLVTEDDDAKVKTTFNTLLTYVKIAATKLEEEKFRKIGLSNAAFQLWRSSSEFCAIRSVTMVSLAQHKIILSHSYSTASSALAITHDCCREISLHQATFAPDDAYKSNDGAVNVTEEISLDSNKDNSEMVVNNDRSKDYTIPAAVQMNPQPSILGQQPLSAGLQYNPGQYMPGPEGYAVPPD